MQNTVSLRKSHKDSITPPPPFKKSKQLVSIERWLAVINVLAIIVNIEVWAYLITNI